MSQRKVFMKTYGCQMNVYDAERMLDVLSTLKYIQTDAASDADLVILNTCHIREKASEKIYDELGRLRRVKDARIRNGQEMIIAVGGCMAQAEGDAIQLRAPYVDLVFGPQTYHRLPEMLNALATDAHRHHIYLDFPVEQKFDFLPNEHKHVQGPSAFLAIQEGCDEFCSYCVVPFTRGPEASRPARSVLDEARRLSKMGIRELMLLGQNVNAYHGLRPDGQGEWTLGRLICELAEIEGIARIRYMTSHPRDVDDDLIAAHARVPQLMPFLHLPVQSGSNLILERMNRRHTVDFYRKIVDAFRTARSDMVFSTDIIVGFPGERDEDFEETLNLINEVAYINVYGFKYSARPGTKAAEMHHEFVNETVQSKRLQQLLDLTRTLQLRFNQSMEGRVISVLVEKNGRKAGQVVGRTPYAQPVFMPEHSNAFIGSVVPVNIVEGRMGSLRGVVNETLLEKVA